MERISVDEFQHHVAREFSVAPDQFPLDVPFGDLGFDSITLVELLGIADQVGLLVSTDQLSDEMTLRGLYESAASDRG